MQSKSKSNLKTLKFSILVVSCFIWSAVIESSNLLLSHPLISLTAHITIILISTLLFLKICNVGQSGLLALSPIKNAEGSSRDMDISTSNNANNNDVNNSNNNSNSSNINDSLGPDFGDLAPLGRKATMLDVQVNIYRFISLGLRGYIFILVVS